MTGVEAMVVPRRSLAHPTMYHAPARIDLPIALEF